MERVATLTKATPTTIGVGGHPRLAELVAHLTDCVPAAAVAAVEVAAADVEVESHDDRLEIVARAMIAVRHGIDLRDPKAI